MKFKKSILKKTLKHIFIFLVVIGLFSCASSRQMKKIRNNFKDTVGIINESVDDLKSAAPHYDYAARDNPHSSMQRDTLVSEEYLRNSPPAQDYLSAPTMENNAATPVIIPFTPTKAIVPKEKSARLAYNYSSEMKRNVSEDINVYVSIVNSSSFVKATLMKIIAQQKNPNTHKTNTDSIVTANILLFKRIKVVLIDPESAFKVDSTFGNGWQDVDSIGDNRWRWTVIPKTNQPSAKLIIKVTAQTPTGAVKDIDDRTFFINVKMTGPFQMIREWWIYLQEHPELFLTVIIIPLIAFFGKRYFDRKSKEQKP